jgi:hypothetical protein
VNWIESTYSDTACSFHDIYVEWQLTRVLGGGNGGCALRVSMVNHTYVHGHILGDLYLAQCQQTNCDPL